MKTTPLIIHGHFYQPPRENPWTDEIETQPDAKPFHDWNERILHECYRPNALAGTFRRLSFNAGPTLLSWLERHSSEVYQKILEGDRQSREEHLGHGNAMAQVYNHMILPLAQEREQRTQIRWGIFDFKKRFGRDPEGMWLPETAASGRTLEILIEEGLKFTILAPEQASEIRPLASESSDWQDVSDSSINPQQPYRFFHSQGRERWMDVFFFDGPLSREVGFGDLLFDTKKFLDRLMKHCPRGGSEPGLVHIACDGETFGHHKRSGDAVLARLLGQEAPRHGLLSTNYGAILEKFPPRFEVRIKTGEGTSWSCSHGLGRWKENCGCHTGGPHGWNQKWRKPLREAVQFLEREAALLFESEGRNFFKDPWTARDQFIELILDHFPESQERFFESHASRPLSREEKQKALKLLEMERYAMLTETSCGWFFNDLAGIETIQILRYALRSLELASEFRRQKPEEDFVGILSQAQSNQAKLGDGREVWEKLVKPARVIW